MAKQADHPFGADKFAHFVLHLFLVMVLCIFTSIGGAIGISVLFGLVWEMKDKVMKTRFVHWPWLTKLTGGPYNIGGHDHFSGYDLLWNVAGALTVYVLRSWPL